MLNQALKDRIVRDVLPRVQTPGQYVGGELNAVVKDPRGLRGRLCLAFPDTYAIGMSHHGLQVLYQGMNRRDDWACERVFAPWIDMESLLRETALPLYGLESFTPLAEFDVLGFTLQYDLCATNVLTILDLGRIPLLSSERAPGHPLVIAGGPCAHNPEPLARFIDLFVIGDGEEALPQVCDAWIRLRARGLDRPAMLAELATRLPFAYVPSCYARSEAADGTGPPVPTHPGVPAVIEPAVVKDLDAVALPTAPVVPFVESVQDRITIEIMRGCPWRCRFCQSNPIKRPVRFRRVETIVDAAWETYVNTGYNEISLLSLSTSDYPHFDELMGRLQAKFRPLHVAVSVPSLRVNEQLARVSEWLDTDRRSGLTLAPEAARDAMREQIGKPITNADLLEGCRMAFGKGFRRVKLYFMCGLPGERPEDLDGIVDLAESIARLGRRVTGRSVTVVANVSNFVPKPHTPYQWNAMQSRQYFLQARERLYRRKRMRSVELKCHDVETSLLEGVLARGDSRLGEAIELAWRRGARFDAWTEQQRPDLWWRALADCGIDVDALLHRPYPADARLPWDHVAVRQGRAYLERERDRASRHMACME